PFGTGTPRARGPSARRPLRQLGLYVHIPFCASRCPYCDFATAPARTALRSRYMDALDTEIRREGAKLGRPRVTTLYVGGGTPSLLEPDEVARLGAALRAAFDLRPVEATVEANPATLDRARLAAWATLGITRLSLGAQSLLADGLRALGRTHRPEDVAPAVSAARSVGLDVSLDLIFGWPGQTEAAWRADLAAAVALGPDHLSCYPLELALEPEEGVANWPGGGWRSVERWRRRAAAAQPDEDGIARRYELAEGFLARSGYRHYEIANWARAGKRCRHNLGYWRNGRWLGLGAGAHSHLAGVRSRNTAALPAYIAAVERGDPRIVDETADAAVDGAMLALRLDEGLDLVRYASRFGPAAASHVRAALRSLDGMRLLRWSGERVRLTPRGRLLASEVFVRLLPDEKSEIASSV
ncbi:MAG TPA: radical SAM family heme chaperone HemW, partial [Candidatus Limnocylindria bacterium]|nr:radical SAM family heme chaperone HemW [Candidatus Limnocylindria bacterium]